eukprot:RCo002413
MRAAAQGFFLGPAGQRLQTLRVRAWAAYQPGHPESLPATPFSDWWVASDTAVEQLWQFRVTYTAAITGQASANTTSSQGWLTGGILLAILASILCAGVTLVVGWTV